MDAPDYKDVWTTELNVAFMDEAGKDAWIAAPKYVCVAEYTHLFTEPSTAAERVCVLMSGVTPGGAPLCVPLRVDAGLGRNWGEAHQ